MSSSRETPCRLEAVFSWWEYMPGLMFSDKTVCTLYEAACIKIGLEMVLTARHSTQEVHERKYSTRWCLSHIPVMLDQVKVHWRYYKQTKTYYKSYLFNWEICDSAPPVAWHDLTYSIEKVCDNHASSHVPFIVVYLIILPFLKFFIQVLCLL
jgi:hypothetical protein